MDKQDKLPSEWTLMDNRRRAKERRRAGCPKYYVIVPAILGAYILIFLVFLFVWTCLAGGEDTPQEPAAHQAAHFSPREVFPAELATEPQQPETVPEPEAPPEPVSLGEFIVTAYCACEDCCGKTPDDPWYGITATGTRATEGRTVAVDPEVIPLGSVVYFRGPDGLETGFVAEDTGGAIREKRIDLYFDSHQDALEWGVKNREVWTIPEG